MDVRRLRALPAAVGFAVTLAVEGLLAFEWPVGRSADAHGLAGFQALTTHPRVDALANWIAGAATPTTYLLIATVLAAVAVARRLPRLACAVPVAMAGAVASADLLKIIVAQVRDGNLIGSASWPSGHATAAMAVGLCAVVVSPVALRPLAALLGGAVAVSVSYSILVLAWHFPSDIVGGFLVAALWVSLMLAVLSWAERVRPSRGRAPDAPAGRHALLMPAGLLALAACAVAVREGLAPVHASFNGSTIAAGAAIALLAAFLTGGLAVGLSGRRGPTPGAGIAHHGRRSPAPKLTVGR